MSLPHFISETSEFISDTSGSVARPLIMMGLLALIGAAMMTGPGTAGSSGISCRLTDSPEINRVLCNLSPERIAAFLR